MAGEDGIFREMVGLGYALGVGLQHHHRFLLLTRSPSSLFPHSSSIQNHPNFTISNARKRPRFYVPHNNTQNRDAKEEEEAYSSSERNSGIISSCLVGLLTGVAVVLFNSVVHEIRDLSWDGIPDRGASWLREAPIQDTWKRVILVPASGGLIVSLLNLLSDSQPFLKAIAASVTLGTGNSLGPEGPSVDIGTSIAKWIASTPFFTSARILPLLAAGSAAGLAAGFNAAVAGCFFAVESVLWPSDSNSSLSLTNSTSTVILSAVIASVISEIGLGSQPAFQVPDYDFRSPAGKEAGVARMIISKFLLQVGMAATLAGVCQVPLTSVLLLFELTQDYRIVLPLLGAVGLSSWISSVQTKRGDERDGKKLKIQNSNYSSLPEISSRSSVKSSTGDTFAEGVSYLSNSSQVESSSRVEDKNDETVNFVTRTLVSEAMKTRYVTVSMCTPLTKVIDLMLAEKQSCAVIVDTDDTLIGLLTLIDIQEYGKSAKAGIKNSKEILVSELCVLNGGICSAPCTATPDMTLHHAQTIMKEHGVNYVPVVRNINERTYPVGLLDPDSISLTYSVLATRKSLS